MKVWHVTVEAEIPYPWPKTFSIEKSSAGAAASLAMKMYRKCLKEEKGKSKKLTNIRMNIVAGNVNE